MSALADALLAELTDEQLRTLAERLRPYLAESTPVDRDDPDAILDTAAMAERLGKQRRYVRDLCRAGRLPGAFKPDGGKEWLCRESAFEAAMSGRPGRGQRESKARVIEIAKPERKRFGRAA